jgi:hypothetical protein
MINDLVKRALTSAEIPSIREANGYYRKDNKRPDGITLIPWLCGKPLLWDVTCTDTLAKSYIELSSKKCWRSCSPTRKCKKIEIRNCGDIIITISYYCESRSTSYLSQRISIAVQRGNAASVLGTIEDSSNDKLEEIFYIL